MNRILSTLALLLALTTAALCAGTTMTPGQEVIIGVNGQDTAGNTASVTYTGCEIDNHALAYCVKDPNHANTVFVVSRGPVGTFTATVTATNSQGAALTQTASFTVIPNPASALVLAINGPMSTNIETPSMPAGW